MVIHSANETGKTSGATVDVLDPEVDDECVAEELDMDEDVLSVEMELGDDEDVLSVGVELGVADDVASVEVESGVVSDVVLSVGVKLDVDNDVGLEVDVDSKVVPAEVESDTGSVVEGSVLGVSDEVGEVGVDSEAVKVVSV